jgi:hypothetical protein
MNLKLPPELPALSGGIKINPTLLIFIMTVSVQSMVLVWGASAVSSRVDFIEKTLGRFETFMVQSMTDRQALHERLVKEEAANASLRDSVNRLLASMELLTHKMDTSAQKP